MFTCLASRTAKKVGSLALNDAAQPAGGRQRQLPAAEHAACQCAVVKQAEEAITFRSHHEPSELATCAAAQNVRVCGSQGAG
jgi:hypothetical protein